MRRISAGMRTKRVILIALATALTLPTTFFADAAHSPIPGSTYCDGTGTVPVGEGPPSQVGVHADVFRPAMTAVAECSDDSQPSYLGTGDKNGFDRLLDRSRDYGVGDVPLTPVQKAQIENDMRAMRNRISVLHHMPLYVDSLAIGYNLACLGTSRLNLRSENLSLIYMRQIVKWNDSRLVADNPSLATCNQNIGLVARAGYAGATTIFKDFLSKRNPQWNYWKDRNTEWPPGVSFPCAGYDETEVADCINSSDGTIGYLQDRAARVNQVKTAAIDNMVSRHFGPEQDKFVPPSAANCQKAANTVFLAPVGGKIENPIIYGSAFETPPATQGDWSTVSITDTYEGYPICHFGYVFVFGKWTSAYGAQNSRGNLRTIVDYLWTAVGPEAQGRLLNNGYAPLPDPLVKAVREGIEAIRLF